MQVGMDVNWDTRSFLWLTKPSDTTSSWDRWQQFLGLGCSNESPDSPPREKGNPLEFPQQGQLFRDCRSE